MNMKGQKRGCARLDLIGGRENREAGAASAPEAQSAYRRGAEKCVNTTLRVQSRRGIIKATGAVVSYGDSPAIGSTSSVARKCGILAVAEDLGIPEADFKTPWKYFFEKGIQNRKFIVAKAFGQRCHRESPQAEDACLREVHRVREEPVRVHTGVRKGDTTSSSRLHTVRADAHRPEQFHKSALYVMDGIWR